MIPNNWKIYLIIHELISFIFHLLNNFLTIIHSEDDFYDPETKMTEEIIYNLLY